MAAPEIDSGYNSDIPYRHGDILSQQQLTDFILAQRGISALKLFTLSYDMPPTEGNATRIHRHLLALADEGVRITVAVDNTYGKRVAPKSDLPISIAKLFGEGKTIVRIRKTYAELEQHQNINLIYNGSKNPPVFPISKTDHRKILLIYKDGKPSSAVIFGSSINYHLDSSIGSSLYISTPEILEWLDQYSETPHYAQPIQVEIAGLTITTRELVPGGNELADREIASVMDNAQEDLLFSSQFLPDGKELEGITRAAQRGVEVSIYSNFPPLIRQPIYSIIRMWALHQLARVARETGNIQFYVPNSASLFIHIMAVVADRHNPTSSKAITGSDNLTNQLLYTLGLRDTLLTINDQKITANFITYLEKHLIPIGKEFNLSAATWRNILLESLPRKGRS